MKTFLFIAALAASFAATALAHEFTVGTMTVDHPIVREMPPGGQVAAGYFTIINKGPADRLIAIETESAKSAELHRSVVEDGIAKMRPLTGGLDVPANATVRVGDDGTHVMFVEPHWPLTETSAADATLVFEKAGRVEVVFTVEKNAAPEASTHAGH